VTANHAKEADNVLRVARKLQGEAMAGALGLPVKASEDFGRYLDVVPGAFVFISGADEDHQGVPHVANYNFNDRLIPLVAHFWIALLDDRFAQ
jgi:hippurate hydrolase